MRKICKKINKPQNMLLTQDSKYRIFKTRAYEL